MSRSRLAAGLIAIVAIATGLIASEAAYIRVQNGEFVDDNCKEFMFSGYNAWQTIEASLNMCCGNLAGLQSQFQEAVKQNFNVVRIFGFPVQMGFNLQTAPGRYNEYAFTGLDRVIAEAGKAGLKLVVALTNNWNYNSEQTDWKCSYTNWTSSAHSCDDFYTDRQAINLYKNHVTRVLTRVNTVTGVAYNRDDTIFAWDLMNEPRSAKGSGMQDIQSWITEVAPFVKGLANHQLVTVGEDGFYGPSNCQAFNGANPYGRNGQDQWSLHTGQDFLPNHMVDGIDYASLHLWPDNWARTDLYFGRRWLDAHLVDQWYLGKPVVIEEFGKAIGMQGGFMAATDQTYADQYNWFKLVYQYAQDSLTSDYGYKGIMFWRWGSVDPNANTGGFDEAATISTNSGVFRDIIEPYSQKVAAFLKDTNRKTVANCACIGTNCTAAAPAPGPSDALAGALAPAPGLAQAVGPSNPPAFAPLRAPGNTTPGTLVSAEPGNPIVAATGGTPIAAPARLPTKAGATVPIAQQQPAGIAVVNAPAGGPVKVAASTAPAVAPAAYVWAGATADAPVAAAATAGRKLMQTKEKVASHASRIADSPISAAALAPLLAPASAPLGALAPAVAAAKAPAMGPAVGPMQAMSAMLSITAPLSSTTTMISDLHERPLAAAVPAKAGSAAGVANAGVSSFQERQQGGPQQPPQPIPLPLPGGPLLPGPSDDSDSNSATPAAAPTGAGSSQGEEVAVQPLAASSFSTESTFSTPAGYTPYNINYKVTCNS
ncbi:hypothetical protein CVIRNUC_008532 [Coccomyxa viridis]|uniref:mannan endo-1,4-beta-mannosidase n=1 Tax=Coccomyxa viridis TaxID=1274662 RepID=A0AAV1IGI7_9CHLO|nr:hypothetical protein CVIRNUC_008532 [Coccomyxa viridis]